MLILMSGVAIGGFYTTSPAYAATVAQMFLGQVGINSTDADEIHDQLVAMPLEKIMEANRVVQFKTGVISFAPVVETLTLYSLSTALIKLVPFTKASDLFKFLKSPLILVITFAP